VSTTGALTVGGVLTVGATDVGGTLTAHGGRLTGLETLLVGSSTETQIRAPVDGKVTIETSAAQPVGPSTPFATFDATDSSVTLTGSLTVAGKNLKQDLETVEGRFVTKLVGGRTDLYLQAADRLVGFADSAGLQSLWMNKDANTMVCDYGCQFRGDFRLYRNDGTTQSANLKLAMQILASDGNLILRDPTSQANYLTTDASARRTTIPSGAKLTLGLGAVLEVNPPPLFDGGWERGGFTVALDYTNETPDAAPTTFIGVEGTRKVWHRVVPLSKVFTSTPNCFLTPISTNVDASRIKTWFVSGNLTSVTFAISIDGPVGSTSYLWTAIGFDSS
jgi:hypothetical protein